MALRWSVGLLVVGGVVQLLARTGAPLCRPDSWAQGHALWHLLTAGALVAWAWSAFPCDGGPAR